MPKSRSTSDQPEQSVDAESHQATTPTGEQVTPLDGNEFLQANRSNRDKYRAEAEAKAAKAARKAERRHPADEPTGADEPADTDDADGSDDATTVVADPRPGSDRTPRKLDPATARRSGSRRWTGWTSTVGSRPWAVIALIVAVVVLAASTAVLAVAYVDADERAESSASAGTTTSLLETARRYAAEISTYNSADYADLDRRIREISTPAFTQTYIESSQDARRGSAEAESVSTATADNAGLMSVDDGKAVVLVTLDQTLKSPQTAQEFPEGFPYQSRVKVTLVEQDGRWLMDDFAVL
ncbi:MULTISPECIES: hypothetical protein [unclassified Gordonia (in: high G+C Gram-positive bacteria)]|uniref:hypothetical protein n=1 Tax=unclassified Gordonia (in: high G+C Gram-positive bacteria) TaxID=2657482 RepID=UPI0010F61F26|nr:MULTISPECIES: hypothetical protein [unclassified Gordonia (in: high G+C Gram-positive bacteria)]